MHFKSNLEVPIFFAVYIAKGLCYNRPMRPLGYLTPIEDVNNFFNNAF